MGAAVLLVHPVYGKETEERVFRPGIEFPISLAYLASFLERERVSCDILDMRLPGNGESTLTAYMRERQPVAVGVTASTANIDKAHRVAEVVKGVSPGTTTIVGGWHASALPEQTLRTYRKFDYVVHGEGETAFSSVVQALTNAESPKGCQGVAYRDNGHVVVNPRAPLIPDLDALPPPARHKLPITAYRPTPATRNYRRLPSTGILVGRGCPYRCLFCYKGVWGRGVRVRSAESVFAEMVSCIEQYGIRDFRFYDDTVTSPKWELEKLCGLITRHGLDVSWNCWSRVNDVDEAKLRMMKEAGCYHIKFGIEFGTEKALRLSRKGATLEQAKRAVALCKKVGIECKGSFIFGIPFEQKEDCAKTIDFALELSPHFATFYAFDLVPGSPYYEQVASKAIDTSRDLLSKQESQAMADRAYRTFYLRPTFLRQRITAFLQEPGRELSMLGDGLKTMLSYSYSRWAAAATTTAGGTAQAADAVAREESRSTPWAAGTAALGRAAAWCTALAALVLSTPVMAAIALAIKLESPGPVLFRQVRVGRNRRQPGVGTPRDGGGERRSGADVGGPPFTFFKFRTMYADARERFANLYDYAYTPTEIATLRFKVEDDPRVTRLGALLRRSTLDELPNFINVLKGDMNLVGPRPEIPEMLKYYEGWQRAKFDVKPGITGLAQINGRGLLSFQDTVRLDVQYVRTKSAWVNARILLRTFAMVVLRRGAF